MQNEIAGHFSEKGRRHIAAGGASILIPKLFAQREGRVGLDRR